MKEKGFTLIELLIVVGLISILAAVAIPQYQGYTQRSKITAVKSNHEAVVRLIQASFANCSSGASSVRLGDSSTNCSEDEAQFVSDFVDYFLSKGVMNPYNLAQLAISEGVVGAVVGNTYVNDNGDETVTVATLISDSETKTTIIERE